MKSLNNLKEFDVTEYLDSEEAIDVFLADAFETRNPKYVDHALRSVYSLINGSAIHTLCQPYKTQTKTFEKYLEENPCNFFNFTLDPLGLIETFSTTEGICFVDVTQVHCSKTESLTQPFGFDNLDLDRHSDIAQKLSELKNKETAKIQWERYLEEFQHEISDDLPSFDDFRFKHQLIWNNTNFSHRFFYLRWMSKHYGWNFSFQAKVKHYTFNLEKLREFLSKSHFIMPTDLWFGLHNYFGKSILFERWHNDFKPYKLAHHLPLSTISLNFRNEIFELIEVARTNPLSQYLDTPGVINVNKLLCHLALKTNSFSHARFSADTEKAVLATLQN